MLLSFIRKSIIDEAPKLVAYGIRSGLLRPPENPPYGCDDLQTSFACERETNQETQANERWVAMILSAAESFDVWWNREGVGMLPMTSKGAETRRVRRMCKTSWSNGEFTLKVELFNLSSEIKRRIEHGANCGGHLIYIQSKLDEILTANTK